MDGASYGAAGLMTWLSNEDVARQILRAKQHRRYPKPNLTLSEERRIIFLGIAVAAGIWEVEFSTALRKLAVAGLGQERLAEELRSGQEFESKLKEMNAVWAEPVGNFFFPVASEKNGYLQTKELPCEIPIDWHGGYILYGFINSKFEARFGRILPIELRDPSLSSSPPETEGQVPAAPDTPLVMNSNTVTCFCGASIFAPSRGAALDALSRHKLLEHSETTASKESQIG